MDKEMMDALRADAEKLGHLTGEDHGPRWMWGESTIDAGERDVPEPPWQPNLSPDEITRLTYKIIDFIHDHDDPFQGRISQHDIRCLSKYLADAAADVAMAKLNPKKTPKRPTAFRVPRADPSTAGETLSTDDQQWRYFTNEAEAYAAADEIGTFYQGLYAKDGT